MEIVGEEMESTELAKRLRRSPEILGDSFGGFTFSGGEPLMQSDFLIELASKLQGNHLAIETSGYSSEDVFSRVIEKMDLVIMDIKLADENSHKIHTGKGNELILNNLRILQKSKIPYLIRTPLIPGITDTEENLASISAIIGDARWERLPYNALAGAKYSNLGMKYQL